MNREEFSKIVMILKEVYPSDKFLATDASKNIWYSILGDYDYSLVGKAVQAYIRTGHFEPKPADIIELLVDFVPHEQMPSEAEAWAMVRKAISRSTYYSHEEFDKFPVAVQKAVGSPDVLRDLAMTDHFNEGVESSNFISRYRVILENMRDDLRLGASLVNARIEATRNIGIEDKNDERR